MQGDLWLILLSGTAIALVVAIAVALTTARLMRSRHEERDLQGAGASRWIAAQLTETMDRFHTRLGDLSQQLTEGHRQHNESLQRAVREQLQAATGSVNERLATSQEALGQGLADATQLFGSVQGRLGQVVEMAQRMDQLAHSVSELSRILQVPKLRGLMGEQTLETMLRQVLPARFFETQHRFADGRTVDAVILLGDRLLPVDAKFPLEAFRRLAEAAEEAAAQAARRELVRAARERIEEITRYIRPGEGTTDYALMFVPAEGVYVELVAGSEDLLDHALSRRVLPVSPATFFAFLSTVMVGMRGLDVERSAEQIVAGLDAVHLELAAMRDELAVLGRHLGNAMQRFNDTERRLAAVQSVVQQLRHQC